MGCDKVYRMIHKEGAEEKKLIGESIPFEKNPNIKAVQKLLVIYGYNPGKIDGMMGARTRVAVERFQKDNGLKPTRFVDEETWAKLKVFEDTPFIVNNELNLKHVQSVLGKAGFNPGTLDGRMGEQTKKAIMGFQKAQGLTPDGRIGYKTLIKLSSYTSKE